MKRKIKRINKILVCLGIAVAVAIASFAGYNLKQASATVTFDSNTAVKFSAFKQTHDIDSGTLLIGTHLIYFKVLTDELYDMATSSANASNQSNVYYKSELSNGAWYDITDADSLDDITNQGTIVPEQDLNDLWITHYTFKDGVTHTIDGEDICIFDEPEVYDLYNMDELYQLRMTYETQNSMEYSDVRNHCIYWMVDFWNHECNNDVTDTCDNQLDNLQTLYENLRADSKDDEAEIVYNLMSRIDATRRVEVLKQVSENENSLLDVLYDKCMGEDYTTGTDSNHDEEYEAITDIVDAIGEAMDSCDESYTTYSGMMLDNSTDRIFY